MSDRVACAPGAALDARGLDLLFREARSFSCWQPTPVTDETLRELYALVRMGPTSVNSAPARFVFVRTPAGKAQLRPALASSNVDKVMTAPVVAVIGYDLTFWKHLGRLFPHKDVSAVFAENDAHSEVTAFRNGTLQGAYLILAARALGLDCGPLSGFDTGLVDQAFFANTNIRTNFLCCLGRGVRSSLFGRLPRFEFADVCELR
jgi:3-hydroxypropanoate dehydrogenase